MLCAKFGALLGAELVAAAQLPQTSDARPRRFVAFDVRTIVFALMQHDGALADDRHVVFKHIEHLRRFVDRGRADEPALGRGSRISPQFLEHRPQFVHVEGACAAAVPWLNVTRGAAVQLGRKCCETHQRKTE